MPFVPRTKVRGLLALSNTPSEIPYTGADKKPDQVNLAASTAPKTESSSDSFRLRTLPSCPRFHSRGRVASPAVLEADKLQRS